MKLRLLLVLLLLSACARPEQPMPLPEADTLLLSLTQGQDVFDSLDGEAKVAIEAEGRFFSSQQFILLEKPHRMRTDVLSSFGQLLLQLAVDRDQLQVFNNTKVPGIYYHGAASYENLYRFTRLPLRFREVVRLLLYDPPVLSGAVLQVSPHKDGVQLSLDAAGQKQEVVFDRQFRVVECRYFRQGVLQLQVFYEKFAEQDGFPQKIRLEVPQRETSASVRFSQVQTNIAIAAERFVIEPPANAVLESLTN